MNSKDLPVLHLTVAGEQWRVSRRCWPGSDYDYDYDWISGPNSGYGFATTGPFPQTRHGHELQISAFLAGIDPVTGYLRKP